MIWDRNVIKRVPRALIATSLAVWLCLSLCLTLTVVPVHAQNKPMYFPPLPQGNPNLGQVRALTVREITNSTGVAAWHADNQRGAGVRIGVLDQGFVGITSLFERSTSRFYVPPGNTLEDYDRGITRHGTDVAEVIQIAAPRADLFLCAYINYNEFIDCLSWMSSNDVQIINHSAGVPALPLDGSNTWAREVDRAVREDVLWVNAAGNFNQGFIRDTFSDTTLNTYHEFRGRGIVEALVIAGSPTTAASRILLSWEGTEAYAANEINLDLYVEDAVGNVIASSTQSQNGSSSDVPLETVQVSRDQEIAIRVRDVNGNANLTQFVLFVEFAALAEAEPGGSIIAPADSLSALTVGALQGNQIAPYSSRGPLVSGALKPDIAAPGEIVLSDGRQFVGTSAAAPFVAGVAAVVWGPLKSLEPVDFPAPGTFIDIILNPEERKAWVA